MGVGFTRAEQPRGASEEPAAQPLGVLTAAGGVGRTNRATGREDLTRDHTGTCSALPRAAPCPLIYPPALRMESPKLRSNPASNPSGAERGSHHLRDGAVLGRGAEG